MHRRGLLGRTPTSPRRAICAPSASTRRCAGDSGRHSRRDRRLRQAGSAGSRAPRGDGRGRAPGHRAAPSGQRRSRPAGHDARRRLRRRDGRAAVAGRRSRARGANSWLLGAGEQLLLAADRLTVLHVATGAFAWCLEEPGTVVAVDAQQIMLAAQDGRDSMLRSLDTATGAEQWRVGYEAHDSTLRPVMTGGVVVAYVVPAGGGPSALQAFDVATGEPRWTAAVGSARAISKATSRACWSPSRTAAAGVESRRSTRARGCGGGRHRCRVTARSSSGRSPAVCSSTRRPSRSSTQARARRAGPLRRSSRRRSASSPPSSVGNSLCRGTGGSTRSTSPRGRRSRSRRTRTCCPLGRRRWSPAAQRASRCSSPGDRRRRRSADGRGRLEHERPVRRAARGCRAAAVGCAAGVAGSSGLRRAPRRTCRCWEPASTTMTSQPLTRISACACATEPASSSTTMGRSSPARTRSSGRACGRRGSRRRRRARRRRRKPACPARVGDRRRARRRVRRSARRTRGRTASGGR